MDLKMIIASCHDADELRTILQDWDIWLNYKAAESVFRSLRVQQPELSNNDIEALKETIS